MTSPYFLHVFLVSAFENMIVYHHKQTGVATVVLNAGSVLNRILAEGFADFFSASGLNLYTNVQVPANDGGVALGQAIFGGRAKINWTKLRSDLSQIWMQRLNKTAGVAGLRRGFCD